MKDKKGQKFHVPDLVPKVRTLVAIFGEKFMRAELNPRTVDKWCKEPDPAPYLTSLKKYFGVVGMKESDMIKPKHEFSERVAEVHSQIKNSAQINYTGEDVIAIYNSFLEGSRQESVLFGQTLKMLQMKG